MISRLDTVDDAFDEQLLERLTTPGKDTSAVADTVRSIIERVRREGDVALLELTNRLDDLGAESAEDLEVPRSVCEQALERIDPLVREALEHARDRIRDYHERQLDALGGSDWDFVDAGGNVLGQRVRPMERVGVYAPGGKAAYPSTVLMTAIPARVAGVSEIILVVPTPGGEIRDILLAAAAVSGVDRMYTVGGAQAVAALAYGTETIPRVDKIVGPGNVYVAMAKEMVFGDVGIDMIAGPSEVVVVADGSARPEWLVMDLFAQAEHDQMAQAILISPDVGLLDDTAALIEKELAAMPRREIIAESLSHRGALIHTRNLAEAADIVNRIAPEHLELAVADPDALLAQIRHAGAIFVGDHSAEVVGDYTAGPSHVLPTGGTARFASPLGVYDFQTRSSLIRCSREGAVALSRDAAILAEEEGLTAHAESALRRVQG